ncbi:MAG TPA: hypothetical protein VJS17_11065 [Pyrinomonadaceae bacterium]|nr:hypothetical protein [Pyrinomonadaceae bacterium]
MQTTTAETATSRTTSRGHDFSRVPARGRSVHVRQRGSDDDIATAARIAATRTSSPLLDVLSVAELADALNELTGSSGCVTHLTIWNHGSPHGQLLGQRTGREGFTSQWLLNPGDNLPALNLLRQSLCCGATMRWLGCSTAGVVAHGGRRTDAEMRTINRFHLDPNEYPSVESAEAHGAVVFGFGSGLINVQSWANATCATIEAANAPTMWHQQTMPGSYDLLAGGRFVSVNAPTGEQCACNAATGRVGPLSSGQVRTAIQPIAHAFFVTLREIAGEITLPAGLPFISPDRAGFVPQVSESNDAAETQPWRLFCHPLDPWSWIVFHPNVILHTHERTRAVMEHELEHCADFHRSLIAFREERWRRRRAGETVAEEPSAPADVCRINDVPPDRPGLTGFWRFYHDWIAFLHRSEDPQRHLQIYEQERRRGGYESWSGLEQMEWVRGALVEVPATPIPASQFLAIEESMNQRFQNGDVPRKQAYVNSFNRVIQELCDIRGGARTDAVRRDNHVRLWNLFSHFEPIHRWWAANNSVSANLNWQRTVLNAQATWTAQSLEQPRFAPTR